MKKVESYYKTACEWHGGQTSPLYSLLSTGLMVHNAEHRRNLMYEIKCCLVDLPRNSYEYKDLKSLNAFVRKAKVKVKYMNK